MPGMRLAPSASTRARSTASNTARAGPAFGRQPRVQLDVVAGGRQRQAVGPAADDGDLALRGHARGLGQLHELAVDLRLARRIADLHSPSPAMARTHRPSARLKGSAGASLRFGLDAMRHRSPQLSATLAALSGSSSPKQR